MPGAKEYSRMKIYRWTRPMLVNSLPVTEEISINNSKKFARIVCDGVSPAARRVLNIAENGAGRIIRASRTKSKKR